MHLRLRFAFSLACLFAAGAAHAQDSAACDTREHCFDAILAAGRAGDEVRQLGLMAELTARYHHKVQVWHQPTMPKLPARPAEAQAVGDPGARLVELVRYFGTGVSFLPEQIRAMALAYLSAQRPDDAERELAAGLAAQPAHSPYWLDLAQVYARQGRADKAVSALVTAQTWALDPAALRDAYRQAARPGAVPAMQTIYTQALQLIDANAAGLPREDAAMPVLSADGKRADKGPAPGFRLENCQVRPTYPRGSLLHQETGTVTWALLIGADGSTQRVRKLKSSGFADLDNAAVLAFATCRATPAVVDGKPVAAWMPVQYVWQLE